VLHERAVQAEAAAYPAWPRQIAALEAWQSIHGAPLEQLQPRLEAGLDRIAADAIHRLEH
jgi:hypothetical protein